MSAPIPIAARLVGGTVMLTCAGAFGYFSLSILRQSYKRTITGVAANGVITGVQTHTIGTGARSKKYFPEVEFQTPAGEKISFLSAFGSNADPKIGSTVKVLYYPDNPRDATVASFAKLWLFPLFFFVFTLAFLLSALLFFSGGASAN